MAVLTPFESPGIESRGGDYLRPHTPDGRDDDTEPKRRMATSHPMVTVRATREGLLGHQTASGYIIDAHVPFVALPARAALFRHVRIRNPLTGQQCVACVLDVGPWNTNDEAYVFGGARPVAERGLSVSGHGTNRAGIDLSEKVWHLLGMTENGNVEWEFVA